MNDHKVWLLIAHIGGIAFCMCIILSAIFLGILIVIDEWRKWRSHNG